MWKHGSSNRVYRLVWNHMRRAFVVAPETARGQRGGQTASGGRVGVSPLAMATALSLFSLNAFALPPNALPTGGKVVSGAASLSTSGSHLTVNQGSNKAIINWQGFDIGSDASVNFIQPSSSSIALNRVTGGNASQIMGSLGANGQVYLVNPAGILFGAGAQVNVGGLVASTLNISNADFLAGKDRFTQDGVTGAVVNEGAITAKEGGRVVLLGTHVKNSGTLKVTGGDVALAAGRQVTLAAGANGHLQIGVDASDISTLVSNGGLIQADGGQIILTAQGANALASAVVSNTGTLQAQTLAEQAGKIMLLADLDHGGTTRVAGTLDASAPTTGNGGFIETSASKVKVADGTQVTTLAHTGKTGTWLIDPSDFKISAGSGAQTTSGIGAETLSMNLKTNDMVLTTDNVNGTQNGDINVNAAVNWSADTTLTLNAFNDININAAITATGNGAGLVLNYGNFAGAGSATAGTDYHVNAPITLSGASATLAINGSDYTLIHSMIELDDIDSTGLGGYYALAQDLDASGTTYGNALVAGPFSGTFAGLGHTLSNLTIASNNDNTGLFSVTSADAQLRDIGLLNADIRAASSYTGTGTLVGENGGAINNVYATGNVSGGDYNSGGLAGSNSDSGSISNAYTAVNVSGAYAQAGGLVGYNQGSIDNAYATGTITAIYYVGGLVGINDNSGSISNVYATGKVTGVGNRTGLVGLNSNRNPGSISNAYWDVDSTDQTVGVVDTSGGTPTAITSNTRYDHNSYSQLGAWSETVSGSGVWVAKDVNGKPQWVMIDGSTRPFLYSEYSTTISNAHQLQLMALDLSGTYTLNRNIDASDANGANAAGMWSAAGFSSIGSPWSPVDPDSMAFSGSLDGRNHQINGLTIDATLSPNGLFSGLFGITTSESLIQNVELTDANVKGRGDITGGLVGENLGTLNNVSVSGTVNNNGTGDYYTGGLVGYNDGTITDATFNGNVSGVRSTGGLTGYNGGAISNAYATGKVNSVSVNTGVETYVGGLVGTNSGQISNAYANNTVNSISRYAGGLVGYNSEEGLLTDVYAIGAVSQVDVASINLGIGGLVGNNEGTISNAYATGNISNNASDYYAGGLVGWNSGDIENAYATGSVVVSGIVSGGLVGINEGQINNTYATGLVGSSWTSAGLVGENAGSGSVNASFWDITSSGTNVGLARDDSGASDVIGLTTAQMTNLSNFTDAGWDIDDQGGTGSVWRIYEGQSTPLLRSFLTAVTVTGAGIDGKTYDGTLASGNSTYTVSDSGASLLGSLAYTSNSQNAGAYSTADGTLDLSGLYSGQQGYDISYAPAQLVIDKAKVIVTANGGRSSVGDTDLSNPGFNAQGLVNGEDVSVLTGLFNNFDINDATPAGNYVLSVDGNLTNGNYTIIQRNDGLWTVAPGASTPGNPGNPGINPSPANLLQSGDLVRISETSLDNDDAHRRFNPATSIPSLETIDNSPLSIAQNYIRLDE